MKQSARQTLSLVLAMTMMSQAAFSAGPGPTGTGAIATQSAFDLLSQMTGSSMGGAPVRSLTNNDPFGNLPGQTSGGIPLPGSIDIGDVFGNGGLGGLGGTLNPGDGDGNPTYPTGDQFGTGMQGDDDQYFVRPIRRAARINYAERNRELREKFSYQYSNEELAKELINDYANQVLGVSALGNSVSSVLIWGTAYLTTATADTMPWVSGATFMTGGGMTGYAIYQQVIGIARAQIEMVFQLMDLYNVLPQDEEARIRQGQLVEAFAAGYIQFGSAGATAVTHITASGLLKAAAATLRNLPIVKRLGWKITTEMVDVAAQTTSTTAATTMTPDLAAGAGQLAAGEVFDMGTTAAGTIAQGPLQTPSAGEAISKLFGKSTVIVVETAKKEKFQFGARLAPWLALPILIGIDYWATKKLGNHAFQAVRKLSARQNLLAVQYFQQNSLAREAMWALLEILALKPEFLQNPVYGLDLRKHRAALWSLYPLEDEELQSIRALYNAPAAPNVPKGDALKKLFIQVRKEMTAYGRLLLLQIVYQTMWAKGRIIPQDHMLFRELAQFLGFKFPDNPKQISQTGNYQHLIKVMNEVDAVGNETRQIRLHRKPMPKLNPVTTQLINEYARPVMYLSEPSSAKAPRTIDSFLATHDLSDDGQWIDKPKK